MPSTRCAQCAHPLVEITLDRGDSTITMQSCSTCDLRSWRKDGEQVALDGVLDLVASS